MRNQVMIGIVGQSKRYREALNHLHYAAVVLYLNGKKAHKVGRGLPVMSEGCAVNKRIVENLRVVWGTDVDLVCEELDKPHAKTVYISANEIHDKIKSRLSKSLISFGKDFSGVARVIALKEGLEVQELKNGQWCSLSEKSKPAKPKAKSSKPKNNQASEGKSKCTEQ
jgi:hypothetical protein